MAELRLLRFCYCPQGTFGVLEAENKAVLYTVERPWADNVPNISCIPVGDYRLRPRYYNEGKYPAIEVCDVPGREYILFHIANCRYDVTGCIGVGLSLGVLWVHARNQHVWAVMESRLAFRQLYDWYEARNPERITIVDVEKLNTLPFPENPVLRGY